MSDYEETPNGKWTRRDFIKTSTFLGGSTLAAAQVPWLLESFGGRPAREITPTHEFELAQPENQIYTVCLQCNTGCPIKVKLQDGLAIKIDANPYSPWGMDPHVTYAKPVGALATAGGLL